MRDYCAIAECYVADVLDGRIVANRLTRLACERHRRDQARGGEDGTFVFRHEAANHMGRFVEQFEHVKGRWARRREKLRLEPFQCFIVTSLFGWYWRETGLRRFTHGYVEMARKNAKSTLAAPIALGMLTVDGEEGPEVYAAATKKDQARIVLDVARTMASRNSLFLTRCKVKVQQHKILAGEIGEMRALEAQKLDGLNPHFAILDELHEHPDSRVFDALDQALGSRDEPMLLMITTAGSDMSGICYQQRDYLERILEGVHEDDAYFGVIYAIDPGDDPFDEVNWIKANPNLGVSKRLRYMRQQAAKAKGSPASKGAFLRKHLGEWSSMGVTAFDLDGLARGMREDLDRAEFAGAGGVLGVDLARKNDLVATAACWFEGWELYVFLRFAVTQAVADLEGNEQIRGWCEAGLIEMHPGHLIDFARVRDAIAEDAEHFGVEEISFDPQFAAAMGQELAQEGHTVVEFRPSPMNMHAPFELLQGLVAMGRLITPASPVLRWNAMNTVIEKRGEFMRPAKRRESAKIDGVSAILQAVGRLEAPKEPQPVSVYESRGILTV